MKIVFFGNTKYSQIGLEIIHEKFPVSLAVTIPDKPSGRKRELVPSAVKQFAHDHHIPTLKTDKLDGQTVNQILKHFGFARGERVQDDTGHGPDFLIVEDYGLILPKELLDLPRYAPLNIHHSLLPKYRGPSPAPTAILKGEKITGVTIIKMTEAVDAGDILAKVEYELAPDETTNSLLIQLNKLGAELVLKVISDYISGRQNPTKQNDKEATYTKRLTKQDGYINPNNPPNPQTLDRIIRAFYPWPGVWTRLKTNDERLMTIKFLPANLIQPQGKRPMSIDEFKNGYPELFEQINPLL